MTRTELFSICKRMGLQYKATMSNQELKDMIEAEKNRKFEESKKEGTTMAKKAYKREDQVRNIASVVPQDVYDRGCTIKLMSNKSVAVKKGRKRLFRLDRLAREYQLTSDRPTLAIDSRTEAVPYGDGKVFYRVRGDHDTVVKIMEKVLAAN